MTRNARLNPRSASGEVIPTTLNASALRDPDGKVIGAIGILRDMRAYEEVVRDLEQSKTELQEKILDLEKFEEVVVGRELKMIALEKDLELLQAGEREAEERARVGLMASRAKSPPCARRSRASRQRVEKGEERRRACVHIMGDLNESNRRLADQRKAMLHILDKGPIGTGAAHQRRLGDSRKAMIHIMGDLRETTQEMERREQELRDKQEQLVQAGKLATLGELTTGVAHELNNPLNNIGLFIGNATDQLRLGLTTPSGSSTSSRRRMEQVRKATSIISHLRTFGRAAPVSVERVDVDEVIERSLSLMQEQLRLRGIEVELDLCPTS